MPGYRYELTIADEAGESRERYWSAFRLGAGSKVVIDSLLLVVTDVRPAAHVEFDYRAVCRPAMPDEQLELHAGS
jgi:hypothetical protein